MRPDGMLTTRKMIVRARQQVAATSPSESLDELAGLEPELAEYIDQSAWLMVGKLALSGVPTEVVQAVRDDLLRTVLTAIAALRRGHYKLWKDTCLESRPPELAPALESNRRPPLP
jgi:hypothetical protein